MTQPISSDKWLVISGGREFTLTQPQLDHLKKASSEGITGLVWYKNFAISLTHISSITKVKKPVETWKDEYSGWGSQATK